MQKPKYIPKKCDLCGQNETYLIGLDRGSLNIVKAIAKFIQQKGVNVVHPRKEMEGIYLTSNDVGNLSRPRFHGLIARVKDNPGNYLLTRKGARFLKNESVPQFAIVSKVEKKQVGYFEPDKLKITARDLESEAEFWEGINYEIVEGIVVRSAGE